MTVQSLATSATTPTPTRARARALVFSPSFNAWLATLDGSITSTSTVSLSTSTVSLSTSTVSLEAQKKGEPCGSPSMVLYCRVSFSDENLLHEIFYNAIEFGPVDTGRDHLAGLVDDHIERQRQNAIAHSQIAFETTLVV